MRLEIQTHFLFLCKNAAVICNCRIFKLFQSVLFVVVIIFVFVLVIVLIFVVVLIFVLVIVVFVFKLIFVSVIHFYHPVLLCAE